MSHHCIYDKKTDPLCPIFSIKKILDEAEPSPIEQQKLLKQVRNSKSYNFTILNLIFFKGSVIEIGNLICLFEINKLDFYFFSI